MAEAITPTVTTPPPAAPAPAKAAAPVKPTTPAPTPGKPAAPAPKPTAETAPVDGAPPPADAAPKPPEDLLEYVVDGEKRQMTREQAIRRLQKETAAEKRMHEAAEALKKAQAFDKFFRERPADALAHAGVDVKAFAQEILKREAETALLSDAEKKELEYQRRIEALETEKKQREEAEAKRQQDERDEVLFAQMEKEYVAAATAAGLEGTPDNLLRMVQIGAEYMDLGVPMTAEQIIAEMRDREDAAFGALEKKVIGGLKGEALAKRLGPAVVEEILKWSIERLNATPAYKQPEPPAEDAEEKRRAPRQPKKPTYTSELDYLKSLG